MTHATGRSELSLGLGTAYIAFEDNRCIGSGAPHEVVRAAKQALDRNPETSVLVFDRATSGVIDIDYRGSLEQVLARLPPFSTPASGTDDSSLAAPRGPGRPKLGVVAREVTLLPRHWDWLARQSGGASVALRKLVDEARRANENEDRVRDAQEATYRFMAAIAGNRPHYEEAARALFAGDAAKFKTLLASWPKDVREHACRLAETAFERTVDSQQQGA